MKRTKTFVTKFLSVLAVGAIVLSSCTKDLEDRLDKVEETLNVVVKNVADLQKQLEDLGSKPEMTVVANQDQTTGKVILTFTNPNKTIEFNGADGNTNDAAKVDVVENADNTTTIGIKQPDGTTKNFTYPTTIPSNITSIVTLTTDHQATAGTTFDVNFFFNTNDGKAITALAKSAISVIKGQVTRTAIETATNVTVNSITPVAGSKNEFTVTFNAIAEALTSEYRIGVAQTATNTVYSEMFDVTVGAAPIVATIGFGAADASAATMNLISTTTPGLAVSNNVTSPVIKGKEFFATSTPAAIGYSSILDRTYEIYKVRVNADNASESDNELLDVVTAFNVNATKAEYDVIAKAISDEVALPAATSRLIAANDHIKITSDKGIVTITPDYTKIPDNQARYFVVMKGRVAGGNYFIVGGIITTNKVASYTYTPAIPFVSTYGTAVGTTLTASVVFETKTYPQLTGLTSIPAGAATYVDVYDKDGKKMNVSAQSITATLNTQNFMEYTFNLDNTMSLVNGETYTVNVKHVYASNPEKFFVIQQSVTVKNPTVAVAKVAAANLGAGYDYAASKITLDSYKAFTNTTDQTLVTFTGTGDTFDATKAIAVTVKNGSDVVAATNYKVFFRIKTMVDGEAVYFDKLGTNAALTTALTPANTYVAAETEIANGGFATDNRIAMDKEYDMDIVVVYTDGNREVVSCKAIYNTAKIVGFKAEANTANIDKLTRVINSTLPLVTLDLSYVKNASFAKPFFFATDKNTTALWIGENKPTDSNPFIKMFNGVTYTVNALTAEQKAKVTKNDAALSDAEATTLVSLIAFPSNAQTLTLTAASNLDAGVLSINASANGLLSGYKLTEDLVQTITAKVTDYYGRTKDLTIEVTIKK